MRLNFEFCSIFLPILVFWPFFHMARRPHPRPALFHPSSMSHYRCARNPMEIRHTLEDASLWSMNPKRNFHHIQDVINFLQYKHDGNL